MGKITFQAALGGTVDLVGPNTATAVTLNLPAASGNIVGTGSTGVVTSAMISGQIAVAQGGTGVSTSTGTGSVVLNTSPTLVTPALGTPASGVLTNTTGLPLTTGVTGILPVANGGSGTATPALVAGTNVSITGTWPNQTINSTASGSGSVTSVATGTGLTGGPITTSGTISLDNTTVTPGTYTAANITIDAQGRITAAANGSGGGGGTVTSVSVVSANGFAGTVATASTTPAITLTTSITGLLKGNGTAISAATAGTDYLTPGGALGTPSSGTLTNATGLPLTTGVTGILPVANGGSGTATPALVAGTNVTITGTWPNQTINSTASGMVYPGAGIPLSTGSAWGTSYSTTGTGSVVALATSPTFVTPILGTPTSVTLTNATGLPLTTGVTGTLAVANGGTGTTTSTGGAGSAVVLQNSPTLSTPTINNGKLDGPYINTIGGFSSTVGAAVLSFTNNAGTTGGSNYLVISNSLANTSNPVTLSVQWTGSTTNQNLELQAGGGGYVGVSKTSFSTKMFFDPVGTGTTSTTLTSSQTANRILTLPDATDTLVGKATSDVLTNKTISGATNSITNVSLTSGVTGTLPVANGGTNQTSYTDGQLLIGNSTGNTLAKSTLTAGSGISITNGAGSITIAATGGTGTVTSVAATVPSFLSVTGSPVTTSGTLAISYSGTALPIANGGTGLTTTPANGALDIGNGTGFTRTTLTAGTGVSITNASGSITIASSVTAVTSVTGTSPIVSSGGTTPAISLAAAYGDTLNPYASKTANYVLAAPNGTAGVPSFRAIVSADIPTLNQNTTGTAANVTATSNATLTTLSVLSLPGSQVSGNISGNAANVTGTVAIGNGGTGQTTAAAGFNALSPITTAGDLILGNGTNSATRLAIGTNGYVLTSNGTTASWAAAGSGSGTVTSITAGTGLTGGTITTSGTIALATTAVTAASYTSANITVDAYGRITAASNGSGGSGITAGKSIALNIVLGY